MEPQYRVKGKLCLEGQVQTCEWDDNDGNTGCHMCPSRTHVTHTPSESSSKYDQDQ